jgi:hypothetical protein
VVAPPHDTREPRPKAAVVAAAPREPRRADREPRPKAAIGVLREGPLHRELKRRLAAPGDAFEVPVDGYVIDLVRADGELVEIQTGGFSALRTKLDALLDRHRIRIVHPIPAERRIVRVDADGEVLSSRPSPLRPGATAIFENLVSFPTLLSHPHLTIEVLLCREDHVRAPAPQRGRRFTRDPGQRRLVDVLERIELRDAADAAALGPELPDPFTTRELAAAMGVPLPLAQKAAACLRALEVFAPAGKRGRAPLYLKGPGPFMLSRDGVSAAGRRRRA